MKKNLIVLVAGLPGVGKTSIANKIAEVYSENELNPLRIDIDDIKREVVPMDQLSSGIDSDEVRGSYYKLATVRASNSLKGNFDVVIMEEVFHRKHLRKYIEKIAMNSNFKVLWVHVTCPYETVENRLVEKNRAISGHILSTDTALRMNREFGKMFDSFSENFITIKNTKKISITKELFI
ncbi:MAG: AAA family ATPase [Minisyncoccia bacterium]